jgi:putative transposase
MPPHSIAVACRTFQISETCYRYSPVRSDENEEIADLFRAIDDQQAEPGLWPVLSTDRQGIAQQCPEMLYLRNVQGYGWNH